MKMTYLMRAALASSALLACGDNTSAGDSNNPDAATGQPDAELGPVAPATDVAAAQGGACVPVAVTWSNPADADGVVVARTANGAPMGAPASGETYAVGDVLPGGGQVVLVGAGESYDESHANVAHADEVTYAVFATQGTRYAEAATAEVTVDLALGAQAGTITIDPADSSVTVTSPGRFTVAGTAVIAGSDLTLELTLTNDACRAVHNPKLQLTDLDGLTPSFPDVHAGDPAYFFGIGPQLDGAESIASTRDFVGMGSEAVTLGFEVVESPTVVSAGKYDVAAMLLDAAGGNPAHVEASMQALSYRESFDSTALPGALSPDGTLAYLGHGQQPQLVVVDLVGATVTGGVDLTGADDITQDETGSLGYVASVTASPDHTYLYVVLVRGDHRAWFSAFIDCAADATEQCSNERQTGSTSVELVRLRRDTLAVVDRLELLAEGAGRWRTSQLSLTPDGASAALGLLSPTSGEVVVIDLGAMTVRETFDTTARSPAPRYVAISPDGARVYIAYRGILTGPDPDLGTAHDDSIDRLEVATGAFTNIPMPTSMTPDAAKTGGLWIGPDGDVYYARKESGGLAIIAAEDDAVSEPFTSADVYGLTWTRDGRLLLRTSASAFTARAGDGGAGTFDGSGLDQLIPVVSLQSFGHTLLLTR
jgi:hypothetical protein